MNRLTLRDWVEIFHEVDLSCVKSSHAALLFSIFASLGRNFQERFPPSKKNGVCKVFEMETVLRNENFPAK
jgi:hypothetical protein